jgi:hypothetical protein
MTVFPHRSLAHFLGLFLFTLAIILFANQILQCPFGGGGIGFQAWKEVTHFGMITKSVEKFKNNLIFKWYFWNFFLSIYI